MFRVITIDGEDLEMSTTVLRMTIESMGTQNFLRQVRVVMRIEKDAK